MPLPPAHQRLLPLALGILLALSFLLYLPVRNHAFVSYDDADYITDNPRVLAGLTWSGVKWAFTTAHASNWHPLTWLSHQLDCTLFGSNAAGPHLVNVALHLANTLLLFTLLRRLTGVIWRSLLVAALFALHPLRVESVAWIAERKDVLSAFFFLLTLHAYARYAASHPKTPDTLRSRRLWYFAALALFALGLMSKPMLVTLPCVLLLLDLWPLHRLSEVGRVIPNAPVGHQSPLHSQSAPTLTGPLTYPPSSDLPSSLNHLASPATLRTRLLEKLPFFALSAISCIITFLAQQHGGAVRSLDAFPFTERLANAAVACARYLEKTAWPADLTVFYPHPGHWPLATVITSALLVLALTLAALLLRKRAPAFTVGWLWFLGMLVPTLGLVQVGNQAFADRYTYLPSIGLFIAIAYGVRCLGTAFDGTPRRAAFSLITTTLAIALLTASALVTARQLPHWQTSERLFTRALAVTEKNYVAHNGLGYQHLTHGRLDDAIRHFQHAVEIHPHFAEAHNNLGSAFLQHGRDADALTSFQRAAQIQPALAIARYNLGTLLNALGRPAEAVPELQAAATLSPDDPVTRVNLGNALLSLARLDDAASVYRDALRLQPAYADANNNLGYVLLQLGRIDEAIPHFEHAVALQPTHANAYYNLGDAHHRRGHLREAAAAFEKTLALQPTDPDARARLKSLRP